MVKIPVSGSSKRKLRSVLYRQINELKLMFVPVIHKEGRGMNNFNDSQTNRPQRNCKIVKPYRCKVCNLHLFSVKRLLYHLYQHFVYKSTKTKDDTKSTGVCCRKCGCVFISEYVLQFHMESIDCSNVKIIENNPFSCHKCKMSFRFLCLLEKHLTTHCDIKCFNCDAVFYEFETYKNHMISNQGSCNTYNFWTDSFNKNAMRNNNNKNSKELEKHLQAHTCTALWMCHECDQLFVNSVRYKNHFVLMHGTTKNPFQCRHCKKEFVKPECWRLHEKKEHSMVRPPMRCEVCEKTFSKKGYLTQHKLTHSNERPWQCKQCNKTFKLKGDLTKHAVVHTGEKPYMCSYCDMTYARSSCLSRHVRSAHTGEKPFICEICQKTFSRSEYYQEHRRIHTGERPYVCHCGASFNYSGNFSNHKKAHDPLYVKRKRKKLKMVSTPVLPPESNVLMIPAPLLDNISTSTSVPSHNVIYIIPSTTVNNSTIMQQRNPEMNSMSLEEIIAQVTGVDDDTSKIQDNLILNTTNDNHGVIQTENNTDSEQLQAFDSKYTYTTAQRSFYELPVEIQQQQQMFVHNDTSLTTQSSTNTQQNADVVYSEGTENVANQYLL